MRILLTVLIIFGLSAGVAHAQESYYLKSKQMTKLKRGLVNVVSFPIELPQTIVEHWQDSRGAHPVKKGVYFVGGVVKGSFNSLGRFLSGFWDVVGSNINAPKDFEPLMKPDYVFGSE